MHTDHAVLTGASHTATATECQDYCLSGTTGAVAWAAIADGCSSAGASDLGARVWALAARQVLLEAAGALVPTYFLRNQVLHAAAPLLERLNPRDCLSTLGVLQSDGKLVRCTLFGDGIALARHRNGELSVWAVEYSANAPLYLQYLRNPALLEAYERQYPGQVRTTTRMWKGQPGAPEVRDTAVESCLAPAWELVLDVERMGVEAFFVCSDGLASTKEGLAATAAAVAAVRSPAGQFVRRRVAKLARDWQKAGGMPSDDLAVGGIWLGPEPGDE